MNSLPKVRQAVMALFALCGAVGAQATPLSLVDPRETEMLARKSLAHGDAPAAIAFLKGSLERHPDLQGSARLLLAKAYLQDKNDFWALRTLSDGAEKEPGNCGYRLWMSWILLQQGSLDLAKESLHSAPCASGGPDHTRAWLIQTMLDRHSGSSDMARRQLSMVMQKASAAYPEDRRAMVSLAESLDPGRLPFLAGRIECNAGWTSNALTGSPADPASSGAKTSSPTGLASAWLRFMGPSVRSSDGLSRFRTSLELQGKAAGYTSEAGRDLSYLTAGFRPAVLVGNLAPRALLGYRYENYLVSGGDRYQSRPLWFYEAHRGEFELELPSRWTLFGGAGRRIYREIGRSRFEVDGGVGWGFSPLKNLQVLTAATARLHRADKDPYDLSGGTVLFSASRRLPAHLSARLGASFSLDDYAGSAGYFDSSLPDTSRRDVVMKLTFALQAASDPGRPGITYEYSTRSSTIDSYEYRDHRILAKFTWSFSRETGLPRSVTPPGHVALDYRLDAKESGDRIQDLLRQDETMQRGSTCLD